MGSVYQNDYHCDFDLVKSWWKDFPVTDMDIILDTPKADISILVFNDEAKYKLYIWVLTLKERPHPPLLVSCSISDRPRQLLSWEISIQWYPLACYKKAAITLQNRFLTLGAIPIDNPIEED